MSSKSVAAPSGPAGGAERLSLNDRLAAYMTRRVGSMWSVYIAVALILGWMALATLGPLHAADPYPFPFLLFLGNVVQLLLVFVILVGQGVLGKSADSRALKTYTDAEAILHEVQVLHTHMVRQDKLLNQGILLVDTTAHPWVEGRQSRGPVRVAAAYIGRNGRIAAWITRRVSSMWAFYVAFVFQFGWMGLALLGVIHFDPYPFAFLLFISSVVQLIFMFVIMVGQDVLGRAGDQRAEQTFLDTEAILHETRRLQRHLTAQDALIVKICEHIAASLPADHELRQAVATESG